MTVVTALAALFFTAKSLQSTRDQLDITEQGQVTDRFGRAIDQLGSDKSEVRLGAIYSLARLMKDSPRDAGTIVEVLSAYVRDHARRTDISTTLKPSTDVQAVLTILGRPPIPVTTRIDLNHTVLRGSYLVEADLDDANLYGADLTGAHLDGAQLKKANLLEASLVGASLAGANLSGAIFTDANLATANLAEAYLVDVDLSRAHGLDSQQLAAAKLSAGTKLPTGVARP